MKHKVVAVIPVQGRLPLLKYTINRLLKKNGVKVVVCVGSELEEKTCTDSGAVFLRHENNPLGRKWNAGFLEAKKHKPTSCLFVGSSDWLSENWLPTMLPFLKTYDLIGKTDFSMVDISDHFRACYWPGYTGEREGESIGIGRLISAKILDLMDWNPFDKDQNNSMDRQMFNRVVKHGGKLANIECADLISLSVSTNKWPNKHSFEDHWNNRVRPYSERVNVKRLVNEFPELTSLKKCISSIK